MDCHQITKSEVAIEIAQGPPGNQLQQLFRCIYALFHESFLCWVSKCFAGANGANDLRQDAEDAFQNGLEKFYKRSQAKTFTLKNNLKTTVYSFGLYQLMAAYKTEKRHRAAYRRLVRFFFEEETLTEEADEFLDEKERNVLRAIHRLKPRRKEIVTMRYFENLPSKEIAKRLHVSPGHVDNEIHKAINELRLILLTQSANKDQQSWT